MRTQKRRGFVLNLIVVTIVHLGTVLSIIIATAIHSCRREKPAALQYMPVQFVAQMPASDDVGKPKESVAAEKPRGDIPKPKRKETVKTKPEKKPVIPPTNKIRRPNAKPKNVSRKEIEDMLRLNPNAFTPRKDIEDMLRLDPGMYSGSQITDEDAMYLAVVRQVFYDAWNQPSYSDVGEAEAMVSISLDKNGVITRRTLAKSSGNRILDDSAMQTVNSVQQIPGLSPKFMARYEVMTISFKVEKAETDPDDGND